MSILSTYALPSNSMSMHYGVYVLDVCHVYVGVKGSKLPLPVGTACTFLLLSKHGTTAFIRTFTTLR